MFIFDELCTAGVLEAGLLSGPAVLNFIWEFRAEMDEAVASEFGLMPTLSPTQSGDLESGLALGGCWD